MTQKIETPEADTQATEVKTDGIDRRSVMKGVAWSLPVIALAIAAPAAAASTTPGTGAFLVYDTWDNEWTDDGAGHINGIKSVVQIQNRYNVDDTYQVPSETVTDIYTSTTYSAGVITGSPAPTVVGAGWSYISNNINSDGSIKYNLQWHGALAAGSSTAQMELHLPATKVVGTQVITTSYAPNAPIATDTNHSNNVH